MIDPTATAADLRRMAEALEAEAAARDRQLGSADIHTMSPQAVEDARARGQFRDLLNGNDPNRKEA